MRARVLKLQESHKAWEIKIAKLEKSNVDFIKQTTEPVFNAARIQQLLDSIPLDFHNKSFDDFILHYPEQSRVKQIAQHFTETFHERLKKGHSIILHGQSGTGKTFLASIICQQLINMGFTVSYRASLLFLKELKERNFESHAAFNSLLAHYQKIEFLVIDEVTEGFAGKEGNLSEWERTMLFTLINLRYQKNLPTLIITHRGQKSLVIRLGLPILGRLTEKGIYLAFNWNSYRQSKGEISLC